MRPDDEFDQLVFGDGRIVTREEAADGSESLDPASIMPNEEAGFELEVRSDAVEVNESLGNVYEEHGEVLSFGSRAKAEAFARRLSAESGALRVQAAAPNDPSAVDGYLLADYDRSIREPASTDGKTWTFDVGANLYGALGEAVVTSGAEPPALEYFVERDLEVALDDLNSGLRISVTAGEAVSLDRDGATWVPDCRVVARDGWNGEVLERYYCEIKTGSASFERSQADAMRKLATEERVLKIRVLIDELPDQYSVRIHEVEPQNG